MEVRSYGFEIRDIAEEGDRGLFTGYASIFNKVNPYYNEIILPGAFRQTLKHTKGHVPIMLDHWGDWVGHTTSATEDERGLLIEGEMLIGDIRAAKERWALMKQGASLKRKSGLSIGFEPVKSLFEEASGLVKRQEIRWIEVSSTPFQSEEEAAVSQLRNAMPLLRQFGILTPEQQALADRRIRQGADSGSEAGWTHSVSGWLDEALRAARIAT